MLPEDLFTGRSWSKLPVEIQVVLRAVYCEGENMPALANRLKCTIQEAGDYLRRAKLALEPHEERQ
jgi:hypothetical protein